MLWCMHYITFALIVSHVLTMIEHGVKLETRKAEAKNCLALSLMWICTRMGSPEFHRSRWWFSELRSMLECISCLICHELIEKCTESRAHCLALFWCVVQMVHLRPCPKKDVWSNLEWENPSKSWIMNIQTWLVWSMIPQPCFLSQDFARFWRIWCHGLDLSTLQLGDVGLASGELTVCNGKWLLK